MSNKIPSLSLVGIKQEELNAEGECLSIPCKLNTSVRPNCLHLQRVSEYAEIDSTSSGDKWHPTSLASLTSSKNPLLPSPAAFNVPTDQLCSTQNVSSSIDMHTTSEDAVRNTSEINDLKCEHIDPSCMKRAENLDGKRWPRRRNFVCNVCHRAFVRRPHLDRHIDAIHNERRDFVCEVCGKGFKTKTAMTGHIDGVHKKLRPYVCDVCGEAFATRSTWNRHVIAIHQKPRDFMCEVCGRGFTETKSLTRHIDAIHKGLWPFICEVCGEAFARKQNVKQHITVVHEAVRPFACEICGKTSATRGNLRRHIDNIHRSMPFPNSLNSQMQFLF